jgi:F-type H+-transporting ATPase subunit gamma
MPSVRDLRDRIRSLRNTQQITKAMKQVAAAKIRRAEMAQRQAQPYADAISGMLHDLIASVGTIDHPFMRSGREGAPRGLIVMTADKGLAGAFNANLTRTADVYQRGDPNVVFYAVGLKARNTLRRLAPQTALAVPLSAGPKIDTAREVAAKVSDDFTAGKISEILLISAKLVSRMSQRPETRRVVPIVAERREVAATGPRGLVEFAPSPEAVLTRLLPKYLEFMLFSAMLETEAAFFAAQLVAMTNATDNANKLIDELTIAMNKARQAAITKEMLEIVGGAEALVG